MVVTGGKSYPQQESRSTCKLWLVLVLAVDLVS